MLCAHTIAAPPQRAVSVPQIVEPRVPNVLRRQILGRRKVFEGANEHHWPREIIVRPKIVIVLDIPRQLAIGLPDPIVGPAFDRPAVLYANDLAQQCGVHLFVIVR